MTSMNRKVCRLSALLLALAALSAAPAIADSVSNLSLSSNEGFQVTDDYPSAQGFTTGTNTAGYTLQSITIRLKGSDPDSVKLHADSSGSPTTTTTLATLSTTDSTTATFTNLTYTCSTGCSLSASTSYHVVVTPQRTGPLYWAQNPSGTQINTPTNAGWSIADDAQYRDRQGGSWMDETEAKLMTVTYSVNPTLTASNVTDRGAMLTIANHSDAWRYKYTSPMGGTCSAEVGAGTSTASVTGLTPGTPYTFKAYSDSTCTKEIASHSFTTLAVELWAENIRHGSAGLQLRNWTGGAWSYKVTGGSQPTRCTIVSVGSYAFAIQLDKGTTHTATAYSGRNCDTSKQIDTETFTTPASIQNYPALSASSITSTGATLTIANHTGDWWYKESADTSGTACKKVDAGTDSATLSGLSPNTFYRYYAYSHEGCDEATVRVTWITDKMDLVTSGAITATVTDTADTWATLAVSGVTEGKWSYRHKHYPYGGNVYPVSSDCESHDYSTASVIVTGLEKGTAYEFLVHRGDSCDINEQIVVKAHTFNFTTGSVGQSSATLKMEHYAGAWHHKQANQSGVGQAGGAQAASSGVGCAGPITGSTANIDGLTPGTEYTWKAYKAEGCAEADAIATATFATLKPGAHPVEEDHSEEDAHPVEEDLEPSFSGIGVADQSYRQGETIAALTLPAAESGDGELTYTLTPALPAGLSFDAATRTVRGTPTAAQPATRYTYTATDADGDRTPPLTFTIEVMPSVAEQKRLEDGLAAQGRAVLSGVTGVIGERFRSPGAASWAGAAAACTGAPSDPAGAAPRAEDCATGLLTTVTEAVLGMSGVGGGAAGMNRLNLADADETRPRGLRAGDVGTQSAWDWESLVWGRSFALPLKKPGTPGNAWTLWGAGDIQGFRGSPEQGRYDGQVRSLYLGVDMQWPEQWLAGAALARSWGETDYAVGAGGSAGQLETTLTSVYPYVRGAFESGLEVWALGGYGRGEAELSRADQAGVAASDLSLAMGATGVRQPMTEFGGAQWAIVGGAGYLSLATEEGDTLVSDLDVAVQRARLAVEATWASGGLAPYVQVGGRYDGGDGQTGAGLETVAGLRYTSERLEFEARGRWLAAHAAEGYEEYGGLARLAVKPRADGTGLQMNVAPSWGAAQVAGLLGGGAALLDGGAMPGLGMNRLPSATPRALSLESELGYGVGVLDGYGVLTPYGGFALTGQETRQYRVGARLGIAQRLNLSLEGIRREAARQQPATQGVQVQLEGRF